MIGILVLCLRLRINVYPSADKQSLLRICFYQLVAEKGNGDQFFSANLSRNKIISEALLTTFEIDPF